MKKVVFAALVAAMVGTPVLAQNAGIMFSAWGRGAFSPFIFVTDENDGAGGTIDDTGFIGGGTGVTWGDPSVVTEFEISGSNDYVGFGIGLAFSAGSTVNMGGISLGGFGFNDLGANIWAQPFGSEMLRLTAGRFTEDSLRGRQGTLNGGFGNFVLPFAVGEQDAIFTRFEQRMDFFPGYFTQGFMISSRPMPNLFIGASATAPLGTSGIDGWIWAPTYANWIFRTTQVGVGYDLDDIGSLRLQFLGGFMNVDMTEIETSRASGHLDFLMGMGGLPGLIGNANLHPRFELGFAFTAIDDLLMDLGFRFHLPMSLDFGLTEVVMREGLAIALGTDFRSGDFRIRGRLELDAARGLDMTPAIGSAIEERDGLGFGLNLVPSFDLGFGWVGLDIAMATRGQTRLDGEGMEDNSFRMGFGAFLETALGGNGAFRVGLTYTLPESIGGESVGHGVFAIPVVMEFWF